MGAMRVYIAKPWRREVYLQQGSLVKAREHAAIAEKQGTPLPDSLRKRLQQKSPAPATRK